MLLLMMSLEVSSESSLVFLLEVPLAASKYDNLVDTAEPLSELSRGEIESNDVTSSMVTFSFLIKGRDISVCVEVEGISVSER